MFKNKKSVTLIELIIAMSLLAIIILGAISFELASRQFLRSSERKTQVLNEMTFILEHISKNVKPVIGSEFNPGIIIPSVNELRLRHDDVNNPTPGNYDDDIIVRYLYIPNNHELTFCARFNEVADSCLVPEESLSKKVMAIEFTLPISDKGGVWVNKLRLRYNPSKEVDNRDNPEVNIDVKSQPNEHVFYSPQEYSWN